MHNSIIATHNTQRATRTYAHAGASSSEQRCSRFHPNHNEDHTKQNRVRTRAAYLQSSVIAQLTALCVAARQQRLRHISQNAGDTVFDKHKPPSAGGHRVYTVKKCERVDAHCHSVYAVKAHPQQAGKLNSSRRAAAHDAGRRGGLKLDKRKRKCA